MDRDLSGTVGWDEFKRMAKQLKSLLEKSGGAVGTGTDNIHTCR